MKRALAAIIALSLPLAGCMELFRPRPVDPKTGVYETQARVNDADIKTYQPFGNIVQVQFVYLISGAFDDAARHEALMRANLADMGFAKVLDQEELTQWVIASGRSAEIGSIADLLGLNRAAKALGPFLMIRAVVQETSMHNYRYRLQAVDPVTGTTHLDVDHRESAEFSFDGEVVFPVQNVLKTWVADSRGRTGVGQP